MRDSLLTAAIAQIQHLPQQCGEEQEHIGDYEHPVPLQDAVGDEAGRSRQLTRKEPVRDPLGGAAAPLFIDLGGNGEQEVRVAPQPMRSVM